MNIVAGNDTSLAIDTSGSIWMWGGGDERLNGRNGGFVSSSLLPYRLPRRLRGLSEYTITNASIGKHYSVLLDHKGALLVFKLHFT